MKIFVEFVDSNAQVAAYSRAMGLTKEQVHRHMEYITFYRQVVKLSEQIKFLLRNKKGNEDKIERLRDELKDTIGRWRNV